MSLVLTGGVALAYAAGVVGIHRFTVFRRRASAQHFATLRWLDWDTLLEGILPPSPALTSEGPTPREGGPPPTLLRRPTDDPHAAQAAALAALVTGAPLPPAAFARASFSGGEVRWLESLEALRATPLEVLARLEATQPNSVAEAYLREWITLTHTATPLNLELLVFSSKRRLNQALGQFGERPALYFARAYASSILGFTGAVVDDLARAVYFSRQAPFYLQAVLQLPFIEDARPALMRACREEALKAGATA